MKKLKLYIETSVWNFLLAEDIPDKYAETMAFFLDVESGRYEIFISEVVIGEIENAPEQINRRLRSLIDRYSPGFLSSDDESDNMIESYLTAGLLTSNHLTDLSHLAVASVNDMDMLISWNLRHIVKAQTRKIVNAVNRLNGYHDIEICTPKEAIEDED
ncbi:MAG: hypothetical protein AB1798_12210 [Spirochaetota bacterium]